MANDYGGNVFDLRRFASLASPQEQSPLPKAYRNASFGPAQLGAIPKLAPDPPQQSALQAALGRFTGTTAATDAYRQHLANLPQSQDYAPSKWRRLGAALTAGAASFGKNPGNAMQLGEEVRDAKFKGALNDWNLRGAGLKEQADMEATNQKGQLAYIESLRKQANEDADNKRNDALAESTIATNRARVEDFASRGYTRIDLPDGSAKMIKPGQPDIFIGPTSKATDFANKQIELGQGAERVRQGGEGVKQGWARVDQAERGLGLEGARVGIARDALTDSQRRTGIQQQQADTTAANQGASYLAPGSDDTAESVAARRIARTNPEYNKYINKDGMIKTPAEYGQGFLGFNKETVPDVNSDPVYKEFIRRVEEDKAKIINTRRPGMGRISGMGGPSGNGTVYDSINFNKIP